MWFLRAGRGAPVTRCGGHCAATFLISPYTPLIRAEKRVLFPAWRLIHPQGTLLALGDLGWPVPKESRDGWWDGLPYPIHDIRPQGYLGRNFARAEHERFGVSENPDEWGDDDIVHVLSRAGTDAIGNLLLGDEAYQRWLGTKLTAREPQSEAKLGESYARQAELAITEGIPASSAGGEFPKFTAMRENGQSTPHVIVKFSGAGNSAAELRWGDLLVCEHLALECAATLRAVTSAHTRILRHAGRTFLESERFDRAGPYGRLPVATLGALSAAFLGDPSTDWTRLVMRLHDMGHADIETVHGVERLWWFGHLIGNTDMHLANLSFRVSAAFRAAPAYDMLPMAYAPLPGGEVPARNFTPRLPTPPQRDVWQIACKAAIRVLASRKCGHPHQRVISGNLHGESSPTHGNGSTRLEYLQFNEAIAG